MTFLDERTAALVRALEDGKDWETVGDPIGRGGRIDFTDADDEIEEADEESFPASDPPAWNLMPTRHPSGGPCSR